MQAEAGNRPPLNLYPWFLKQKTMNINRFKELRALCFVTKKAANFWTGQTFTLISESFDMEMVRLI